MLSPLVVFGDETVITSGDDNLTPTFESGHWVEQFARQNGFVLENYASTNASVTGAESTLNKQIDEYPGQSGSKTAHALIWIGKNDGLLSSRCVPEVVANQIEAAMRRLQEEGKIRSIYLCTQFDLTRTPFVFEGIMSGGLSCDTVYWLSYYCAMLAIALRGIVKRWDAVAHRPDTKVHLLDLQAYHGDVLARPTQYGLRDSLEIQSKISARGTDALFKVVSGLNPYGHAIVASFVPKMAAK